MPRDDDDTERLLCRKNAGKRGQVFEEWLKEYLDACGAKGDEDASWEDTFLARDQRAGLSAAALKRGVRRNREAVASLIQHQDDKSLKAVLRAEAKGLPAPYTADARVAMAVLRRECGRPDDGLTEQAREAEWHGFTIAKNVGVTAASITDFNRLLTEKNAQLPARLQRDTDAVTEKLLNAITVPAALASMANDLLQTAAADRPTALYDQPVVGPPAVPGGWRRRDVVAKFDGLWRAAFERGELRFAVATGTRERNGPSPRADGLVAHDGEDDDGLRALDEPLGDDDGFYAGGYMRTAQAEADEANVAIANLWHVVCAGGDVAAFVESLDAEICFAAIAKLEHKLLCFNCFGAGHYAKDCPSPPDMGLTREDVAKMLTTFKTRIPGRGRFNARFQGRTGRGGRGMTGRGGHARGGRGGRGAARTAATGNTPAVLRRAAQEHGHDHGLYSQGTEQPDAENEEAQSAADTTADTAAELQQGQDNGHAAMDAGGEAIADDQDDLFDADAFEPWRTHSSHSPLRAGAAAIAMASVAVLAGAVIMVKSKILPSPRRLATLLVLAGAQTGHALSAPCARTAAISGVAGGALLATYGYSHADWLAGANSLPTDVAMDSMMLGPGPGTQAIKSMRPAANDKCSPLARLPALLVDCGATSHMVSSVEKLSRVTAVAPRRSVRVASGQVLRASHIGDINMRVRGKVHYKTNKTKVRAAMLMLTGVLVVPGLAADLFSCHSGFHADGIKTYLNDERYLELPTGERVDFADGTGKRYQIEQAMATGDKRSADVHPMLAHFGADRILMAKALSKGLPIPAVSELHNSADCIGCALGGAHAPHIGKGGKAKGTSAAKAFGDSVSSDVCGPFPRSAITGFRYVIGFSDRATRYTALYFMVDKTPESVRAAFETFVADHLHLMPSGRVKQFYSDNGGEYTASTIDDMLNKMMTRRALTVPYTPQRNGQMERFWYTVCRQTRILLAASGHSDALWPFAMAHVAAVHNRLPTRALSPPRAPLHAATGQAPSLGMFRDRVWGCDAVVHARAADRESKLSPTGVASVYLGRDEKRNGEYHFIPELNKIMSVVKAHRYFPESFTKLTLLPEPVMAKGEERDQPRVHLIGNHQVRVAVPTNYNPNLPVVAAVPMNLADPHRAAAMSVSSEGLPASATVFSSSLAGDCFAADVVTAASLTPPPPSKHGDIYGRPDEEEWLKAEIRDLEAKMAQGAFEVVKISSIPAGRKLVKSKYAYVNKFDAVTNELCERRARLVGCGYSQTPDADFDETTCGTMRGTSVRSLFCTAAIDDMDIYLGDVIKAFTQSEMDKEIYVQIPPQFNMPGYAFKAKMSLEGLKQSGHLFQKAAYARARELGGRPSDIDPNIWFVGHGAERIIIGMWVDDMLILTPKGRRDLADKFWKGFRERFNCKDLVVPAKFVGLEIKRDRDRRKITLTQTRYIDAMFSKFMSDVHSKTWALPVGGDEASLDKFMKIGAAKDVKEAKLVLDKQYMSIIGSLLFASAMTRPDISFHTAYLAKLMQSPSSEALEAAQGVLCYLKRTREMGLTFGNDERFTLYTDSSFGRSPRPMAGHAIMHGGAALSWTSKALKIVPLSSAEAEAAVMSLGVKDARYTKMLMAELRPHKKISYIDGRCDNTAAIDIIKAHGLTARSKHFERWAAYVRDDYQRGILTLKHCTTDRMITDIFTKALPHDAFKRFRDALLGAP